MKKDLSSPRVGIALFVWKNNKFLMGKRVGLHGTNSWSIPGGHLEHGESFEACARRETLEETGMRVKNINFLAITNDIFPSAKHYITLWFKADWQSGKPTILETEAFVELGWVDFHSLPEPLFEPCWQNLRQSRPDLFS
ncbi:MAG TPA: NUDIX domain-containing protein [Candidatus Dormibacteraeota bacterium]|nr:NUDIX domain-containing protein [Candidatus Dormibacteraeota bacterium]